MINERVTVTLGGTPYDQWKSVEVDWSYEKGAQTFSISVGEPNWSDSDAVPFLDEELTIEAGSDLLVTGYIDAYEASAEGESHDVTISGRSKGADAIDSSAVHKTGRITKKPLDALANELSQSTGVAVRFRAKGKMPVVPKIQLRLGETVFAAVERMARRYGMNLSPRPDGHIEIGKPEGERMAGHLVQGLPPVKKASVSFSRDGQASKIIVKGQRSVTVKPSAVRQKIEITDPSVKRTRPLIIYVEGDASRADLESRGKWHADRQAGRSKQLTVTCSGWRDSGGQLWRPGYLIPADMPLWHVKQDMLIQSVKFKQALGDTEGTTSVLTLVDPKAHGGKGAGKSKSGKSWDKPEPKSQMAYPPGGA